MANIKVKDAAASTVDMAASGAGNDNNPYIILHGIQGRGSEGSAIGESGRPVLIGADSGQDLVNLQADSTSQLLVAASKTGNWDVDGTVTVAGGAAEGAAISGNPVPVGLDTGQDVVYAQADSTSRLLVSASKTGNWNIDGGTVNASKTGTWAIDGTVSVAGAAAEGAAISGNPVPIGLDSGQDVVYAQADSTSRLLVSASKTGNWDIDGTVNASKSGTWAIDGTVTVAGAAAEGAAISGNPIPLGLDTGEDVVYAQANATSDLKVTLDSENINASKVGTWAIDGTVTVAGAAAEGAAISGNPVPLGLDTGEDVVYAQADATSRLLVSASKTGTWAVDGDVSTSKSGTWGIDVIIPGTNTSTLGKAEDVAHTTGDVGVAVWAVRSDAGNASLAADGDYHPFMVNASGQLLTSAAVTVNSEYAEDSAHTTADTGTFVLAVRNDAGNASLAADLDYHPLIVNGSGQLLTSAAVTVNSEYAEDSVHTTADTGTFILAVRRDSNASLAADGDYHPLTTDASGALWTNTTVTINAEKNEDAAHTTGDTGMFMLAVRNDSGASHAADADYHPLLTDASGNLRVGGAAAEGAAIKGNPLVIGLDTGQDAVYAQADSTSRLLVSASKTGNWNVDGGTVNASKSGTWAIDGTVTVAGAAAEGAAISGNPVPMGLDTGQDVVYAQADATSQLLVAASKTGNWAIDGTVTVAGGAAEGAAISGNPVPIGLDTGQDVVYAQSDATSRLLVSASKTGNWNVDGGTVNASKSGSWSLDNTTPTCEVPQTTGGLTPYRNIDVDETFDEATDLPALLYTMEAYNKASALRYLKLFNGAASSIASSATTPTWELPLSGGQGLTQQWTKGLTFSNGITVGATVGAGQGDGASPTASDIFVNISYNASA